MPLPLVAPAEQAAARHTTLLNALVHGIDARARSLRKKASQMASENEKKFERLGLDPATAIEQLRAAVAAAAPIGKADDELKVGSAEVPRQLAKVILAREERRARFSADAALCETVDAKAWQQRMIDAGWRSLVPLSNAEKVVNGLVTVAAALGAYEKWRLGVYLLQNRPAKQEKPKKPRHPREPREPPREAPPREAPREPRPDKRPFQKRAPFKKRPQFKRGPPPPVYDNKPKVTRHNVIAPNGYASQQVSVASLFMDNLSGKKRPAPSQQPRHSKPRLDESAGGDARKDWSRPWERKVDPQRAPKPTKIKFSE